MFHLPRISAVLVAASLLFTPALVCAKADKPADKTATDKSTDKTAEKAGGKGSTGRSHHRRFC